MKPLRKAVFPVGGLGTRFLPATKAMPKEMLPLVDKPLIQYAFDEAVAAGIEEFIFVTGRNKNIISNHFDTSYELERTLDEKSKSRELELTKGWLPKPGSVAFVRQQQPMGLGHAVWCARNFIQPDEPFAVLLADDVVLSQKSCLQQMREVHEANDGASVVAVEKVPADQISSYGVIRPEGDAAGKQVKMQDMVEKPKPADAPSDLAIIGRYILNYEIFDLLENQAAGAGGEIQLTDAMSSHAKQSDYFALQFDGRRFDCGSKLGFLEANLAFSLDREDMRAGVLDIMHGLTADKKKTA